ncbi:MAG: FKBP-type peptidyl-prolyl cis-trans isomerase [Desulfuromonadales bacterium]|nr:FKBP-type peptidyl-prolyl cis-trans isomerase [Desulfuromonadales bacterium]
MMKALPAFLLFTLLPVLSSGTETAKPVTEAGKVSYSVGYQVGGDFQRQGWEIDSDALVQGIRDAISKSEPQLSQAEMNATLMNLKKKLVAEQQSAKKQSDAAFLTANAKQPGVTVLPSGVQYRVLQEGSGRKPAAQDSVSLIYRVSRADGTQIGSTEPGKPKSYPVAKAVPGLQEVLQLMAEGAKWQIVIPPGLATGDREPLDDMGVIIYDLELVSVQPAT